MVSQPTISKFFKAVSNNKKPSQAAPAEQVQTSDASKLGTSQDNSICLSDFSEDELDISTQISLPISTKDEINKDVDLLDNLEIKETAEYLEQNNNNDHNTESSEQFNKKLENILLKRSRRFNVAMNEQISDEESISTEPATKRKKKSATGKSNLTPLDKQIQELKLANKDKLLVVRVGYKYKCFAEDAVIASQILHIMLIPGKLTIDESNPNDANYRKFAYCSFPDTRLNVHLENLIHNNIKVGVVEQSETSVLKKHSENKNNVFERKVTNTFSKATYSINHSFTNVGNGKRILGGARSIWLLKLETIHQKEFKYSIMSVNLNSGEIICDEFLDNPKSTDKLVTRIKYLEPAELIFVSDIVIPKEISKLFSDIDCQTNERKLNQEKTCSDSQSDENNEDILLLQATIKLLLTDRVISSTFSATIPILYEYLKDYGNEQILVNISNYKSFTSKVHMLLDGNALESLNIFSNDGRKGSLFWLLDHTRTPFGFRLLKEWVMKPLINRERIVERLDGITCMMTEINSIFFESLSRILQSTPDLLHTLNRISYGCTSRREVFYFLKQIDLLSKHFNLHSRFITNSIMSPNGSVHKKSKYITRLFLTINDYFREPKIANLLSMINVSAVMEKDLAEQKVGFLNLNNYDNPDILLRIQRDIEGTKNELKEELTSIRSILNRPQLKYKDEVDYLIEVRNSQIKNIPADWIKVNNTKAVSRFNTPATQKLVEQLTYHKELLAFECEKEYKVFLTKINNEYSNLKTVIQSLAEYDCILSLAATSCNLNYTRPIFTNESNDCSNQNITVKNGRNPVIESLDISYVPNDINMSQHDGRINIITGPNMGGKSSYIRQAALLIIIAQIGCFVPADSMKLSIFDNILTRIGSYDDLLHGNSTFKVEMQDILHTLKRSTSKSLLLLDEVGRGTGTLDGKAISYALLKYFVEEDDICPLVLFTTHFPELGQTIKSPLLKNYYMDFIEDQKEGESWRSIIFLYSLKPGVSYDSYGLNVAKLAQIDNNIINRAFAISEKLKIEELQASEALQIPLQIKGLLEDETDTHEKYGSLKRHFLNLLNSDI